MHAFIRRQENFICEHCSQAVVGNGYTNHCPHCLWSKHVDNDPGDRLSTCGGMMEPWTIEGIVDHYIVTHKCASCGHTKRNSIHDTDNSDALVGLVTESIKRSTQRI